MSDNYHLLKHELRKDFWELKDALNIVSGWVEVDTDPERRNHMGERYTKFVPITKTNLKRPDQRLYNGLLDLWKATDHDFAEGDQNGFNLYAEKNIYRVTYILKWCKKKQVEVPWFDWAVEQELIDPSDVAEVYPSHGVTDNGNTGANRMPENKQMGKTERENLVRLIGILRNMLKDDTVISDLKRSKDLFKESKDLTAHISGLYKEDRENKGLGPTKLNTIWAEAKKILKKDEDF